MSQPASPSLEPVAIDHRYLNREMSWLEFNARVLQEALSETTPTLERLKFLAIFSSNLDEFFMVRVAGLHKMLEEGILETDSPERTSVRNALAQVRSRTIELQKLQYACLNQTILPKLRQQNIALVSYDELSPYQTEELSLYFDSEVFPVLTPLAYDPAHPFPFLSNRSLYILVIPEHAGKPGVPPVGFIEVPAVIQRLVPVRSKNKQHQYILLEDLIAAHIDELFVGYEIKHWFTIRVTRNLDYTLLENKVVDLLSTIQREMINREHNEVVRLEIDGRTPSEIIGFIQSNLRITPDQIYAIDGPLYLQGLMQLYRLPFDELRDESFNPRLPAVMAENVDIFSLISREDIMVHHPYDSFYAVTEFVSSAAHDPEVLAIKQTLYRTAGDSPIIDALITAAENGKQVTAVVELKARFDEKNNIIWARRLEHAGVHVVFGFVGLKTHCKLTLVIRREAGKLVRYTHVSTGNYNSATAKLYTDVGVFSRDQVIGADVGQVFNLITGFNSLTGEIGERPAAIALPPFEKLAVAPLELRERLIELIDQEIECKRKHGSGHIIAKMNALNDKEIIDKLYEASMSGVTIELIVRGICSLRPGVPGLSENIKVISIIDRFLEHSRIYYFQAAGQKEVFLSSADMMPRNMDRRIEILYPIENPKLKTRLVDGILRTCLADNIKAHELMPDGTWKKRQPAPNEAPFRSQYKFIEMVRGAGIKSIPYEIAIRHNPIHRKGERPVAKRKPKMK